MCVQEVGKTRKAEGRKGYINRPIGTDPILELPLGLKFLVLSQLSTVVMEEIVGHHEAAVITAVGKNIHVVIVAFREAE